MQRQVVSWVDDHRDSLIDFTCDLVATPSVNPPGDERAVADVVAARLKKLEIGEPEIVAKEPHRPNVLCRMKGADGGPVLCYNGHIDTKPVGDGAADDWETDPLTPTIIGDRLYGLGSTDMKSGVASLIYASAALRAVAPTLRGDLLLALTADEETGSGYGAIHLANDYGLKADIALIAEPSGVRRELEQICIASRGTFAFEVRVRGTQMHSSISDQFPSVNASVKMAEILARMQHELVVRHDPHPLYPGGVTRNVGVMVNGGVWYGVYPGEASFACDIRILPGMTPADAQRDVEAFVDGLRAADPDLDVEIVSAIHRAESMTMVQPEVPADDPFVRILQDASATVTGEPIPLGGFAGGTDAIFLHGYGGIPTIPAFGPGLLPLAHGANEYVGLESIVQACKIHALAALAYLE